MFHSTYHRFTPDEKRILAITCPSHFFTHFFILVFPAVTMPLVSDLHLPIEDVVRLSFFMYLAYGLCALPVGLIVDHWQARGMLVIGNVLMGFGILGAAIWPGPKSMPAALALVGVGASVYHPAGLALISRTIGRRGLALGINGVFGNLGIASSPLVTGILTWAFGWKVTFLILGAVGIATGGALAAIHVNETHTRTSHGTSKADTMELARYFVILCIALVFAGISYRGNMILLPAYLQLKTTFVHNLIGSLSFLHTHGTATLAATVLTSIVLLTGIFGQILGGRLADRIDLRNAYILYHAASLPFIALMSVTSNYALAVCAAIYAFFSLGMQPIENSLIASLTPQRWRSTSFAVKFILNFGVGASAVYLVGAVKRAYSLGSVYWFLAGSTAMVVIAAVVLRVASRKLQSVRN